MTCQKPRFRPSFQTLETRRCFTAALGMDFEAPPEDTTEEIAIIAVSAGETYDAPSADPIATDANTHNFFAFDPVFRGEVRVSAGNMNGDSNDIVITGTGLAGGAHIRVIDAISPSQQSSFFAFDPTFTGGVFVAAGDVNGDGGDDIITNPGLGGGPHVRVFSGVTGDPLPNFFAFEPAFSGVRVNAGDANGDSSVDIITTPGTGGVAHLQISTAADGNQLETVSPYGGFAGGVRVATGDINGDGSEDIITTAGPHVRVFDGVTGAEFSNPVAHDQVFSGGVFVAAGDVDGDSFAEIITVPGTTGGPHVRVFDGVTGTPLPTDTVDSIFRHFGRD